MLNMPSRLDVSLYSESVHGKTMSLSIQVGNTVHNIDVVPDSTTICTLSITLPSEVIFVLSGRDDRSTIVDNTGNILENRIIKINSIRLDGLELDQDYLENFLVTIPDNASDEPVTGSVLCVNGVATLDLNSSDSLQCVLTSKLGLA